MTQYPIFTVFSKSVSLTVTSFSVCLDVHGGADAARVPFVPRVRPRLLHPLRQAADPAHHVQGSLTQDVKLFCMQFDRFFQ